MLAVAVVTVAFFAQEFGLVLALPELDCVVQRRNEYRARWTMLKIHSAQSVLQGSADGDANGNREGRFGFFHELAVAPRLQPTAEVPADAYGSPVLPLEFQRIEAGRVHACGYVFEMFLPARGGGWVSERDPAAAHKVDERLAATSWLCYAWPESWGTSGRIAYVATSGGALLFSRNADRRCDGERGPRAGAGFLAPQVGSNPAAMVADCHGEVWYSIG